MHRAIVVTCALLALSFGAATTATAAEDVTFSKDVAPIIFDKCVSCHRPGELAPMALRSYIGSLLTMRPTRTRWVSDFSVLPRCL